MRGRERETQRSSVINRRRDRDRTVVVVRCCFVPDTCMAFTALHYAKASSKGTFLCRGLQVTVPKTQLPFEYKYSIVDKSGTVVCKEKDAHKAALDGAHPDAKFIVRDEVSDDVYIHTYTYACIHTYT
jgi:hypothetical protein